MTNVREKCVRVMTIKLNDYVRYALKVQKNCLAKCSYDFVC